MIKFYDVKFYLIISLFISVLTNCKTNEISSSARTINLNNNLNNIDTSNLKDEARRYVIEGSKYQMQGLYANAILEFQDALLIDSSSPGIFYSLAKCYESLNKIERAIESAKKSLNIEPYFLPSIDLLIDIYIYRLNISDAIELNKIASEVDSTLDRKLKSAWLSEFIDPKLAIEMYEKLVPQYKNPFIFDRLSNLYFNAGDTSNYINTLLKINQLEPGIYQAGFDIISFYCDNSRYDNALSFVKSQNNIYSINELDSLYSFIGVKLYNTKKDEYKESIQNYLQEIDNKFYTNTNLIFLSSYLSMKINDTLMVRKYFDILNKYADLNLTNILQINDLYQYLNLNNEGIKFLSKYIETYPDSWQIYYLIGFNHQFLQQNDSALYYFNKSLKFDSTNADILSQIGNIYDKIGKYDLSDSAYLKAIEFDPENGLICNNYAYILAERNTNLRYALLLSQKAIDTNPEIASYLDTYGWIKYRMGELEEAMEYIKKSLENDDTVAEVHEHLGIIYFDLNMYFEAKEALNKALSLDSNRKKSLELLELIKKERK